MQIPHEAATSLRIAPWFPLTAVLAAITFATGLSASEKQTTPGAPASAANYELGKLIRFGKGGESETYRRSGWSDPEADFTWTTGQSANLLFGLSEADHPLKLRMKIGGFMHPPKLTAQPVEIFANDRKIAEWEVSDPKEFTAVIPTNLVADRAELTIEIRTPKAASLQSLGASTDSRVLGVNCFELSITKSDE